MGDELELRLHGDACASTLIHLPGLHGDWTLLAPFRHALGNRAHFIETTYPLRADWSLDDYASALDGALQVKGITSGWILAESFSSQVAWALLCRQQRDGNSARFHIKGLILVGGFVRHPWPWGVRLAQAISRRVPMCLVRILCRLYSQSAKKRFHHCAGAAGEFEEFVLRRTNEQDRSVITRRYGLIEKNNPGSIARETKLCVYHLSGAWDPIVPWWHVRLWLRKNCPGYRATRIIWNGGHNVLLSSPQQSADQILAWAQEIAATSAAK
jgi:pimeloyl-ACP methyl ester carboxylesterase